MLSERFGGELEMKNIQYGAQRWCTFRVAAAKFPLIPVLSSYFVTLSRTYITLNVRALRIYR